MLVAKGILTQRGGATSHAAVVARGLGKPVRRGLRRASAWTPKRSSSSPMARSIKEGDSISIDGTTGEVFAGAITTVDPDFDKEVDLVQLLAWADEICAATGAELWLSPTRGLYVWANADYPRDARVARKFGAKGIGLCRTEHMFFEQERLPIVQQMILNASEAQAYSTTIKRAEEELKRRSDDAKLLKAVEVAKKAAKKIAAVQGLRRGAGQAAAAPARRL